MMTSTNKPNPGNTVQHFVGIRYGLVEENLKVVRTSLTELKDQMKESNKLLPRLRQL